MAEFPDPAKLFEELLLAFSFGFFIGGLMFWMVTVLAPRSYSGLVSRLLTATLGVALAVAIGCVIVLVSRKTGLDFF